ncbi:acyl-CoA dehydrogenase family protein [Novosphingobium sp.]|uniref:acyl-CoA dehydrogenase family protein n=1 Tax=Novosphingobium sp. TaxID=1874826 RepID=UPI00261B09ED|nr:acyl-CoA dehydrogenase family protein [Novosphingobium sp.]
MLDMSARAEPNEELAVFREQVRRFVREKVTPNIDRWEDSGLIERDFWLECGAAGLLCPQAPEELGGLGLDYSFNAVINEEISYSGATVGTMLQSDITSGYLIHYGSDEQKQRWLPGMVSGEVITAIAMTEPGGGSDLQGIRTTARREGDNYVISGAKTYITNGILADLVIVVAKTDPSAGSRGISLLLVEADREGFKRGRKLDKIGQKASDTAELFFEDVRVPKENLLGSEGAGFGYLMSQLPQERLQIAILAQAAAQRAFDEALSFTSERKAFGKVILSFQNTQFVLAELATKLQVGWSHIDWALQRHVAGRLSAKEASAAKLWHTELQFEVCDRALQLHGGAGYMNEYPIARLWRDARVQQIYGGTSEIMKLLIGRNL